MNNKDKVNMVHIPLKTEHEFIEKDYSLFAYIGVIFVVGAVSLFLIG